MYKKRCCTCKVVVVISFYFLLILSHSKTGNNCFATLLQYELNSDVVTFCHQRSNLSSNKRVSLDLLIFCRSLCGRRLALDNFIFCLNKL